MDLFWFGCVWGKFVLMGEKCRETVLAKPPSKPDDMEADSALMTPNWRTGLLVKNKQGDNPAFLGRDTFLLQTQK